MSWLINGKEIDLREAEKNPNNDDVVKYILNSINVVAEKLPAQFDWKQRYRKKNPAAPLQIDVKGMKGITTRCTYFPKNKPSVGVQFYERVDVDERGNRTYVMNDGNTTFNFTGGMVVDRNRLELAVFMFGLLDGSLKLASFDQDIPFVYIDKKANAQSEADLRRERLRIDKLVEEEITDDILVSTAKSLGISFVDDMSDAEIRNEIAGLIAHDKTIEAKIRESLAPNPTTELKVQIQEALDKKYIRAVPSGTTVAYFGYINDTEDRKILAKGKNTLPIDALYNHFAKSTVEQEYLSTLLEQEVV